MQIYTANKSNYNYDTSQTIARWAFSCTESYRFGFQGQEKDDEIKGAGNSINYKFRMHDPWIGRWLSVDPLFDQQPGWTPYKAMYNNPIFWTDPKGGTEEERLKAVATARKSLGFKYKRGTTPASGSTSDCSGLVRYCMSQNETISDPISTWQEGQNGVATIINVSTKLKSVNDLEVGNAVTIASDGNVHGHVMIVSEVTRNDDGNVSSYKVIHVEGPWTNEKLGLSGGGDVNETEIIVGGTHGYSRSKYKHEFYKWDNEDENTIYGPYKLPEMEVTAEGETKKMEPIKATSVESVTSNNIDETTQSN